MNTYKTYKKNGRMRQLIALLLVLCMSIGQMAIAAANGLNPYEGAPLIGGQAEEGAEPTPTPTPNPLSGGMIIPGAVEEGLGAAQSAQGGALNPYEEPAVAPGEGQQVEEGSEGEEVLEGEEGEEGEEEETPAMAAVGITPFGNVNGTPPGTDVDITVTTSGSGSGGPSHRETVTIEVTIEDYGELYLTSGGAQYGGTPILRDGMSMTLSFPEYLVMEDTTVLDNWLTQLKNSGVIKPNSGFISSTNKCILYFTSAHNTRTYELSIDLTVDVTKYTGHILEFGVEFDDGTNKYWTGSGGGGIPINPGQPTEVGVVKLPLNNIAFENGYYKIIDLNKPLDYKVSVKTPTLLQDEVLIIEDTMSAALELCDKNGNVITNPANWMAAFEFPQPFPQTPVFAMETNGDKRTFRLTFTGPMEGGDYAFIYYTKLVDQSAAAVSNSIKMIYKGVEYDYDVEIIAARSSTKTISKYVNSYVNNTQHFRLVENASQTISDVTFYLQIWQIMEGITSRPDGYQIFTDVLRDYFTYKSSGAPESVPAGKPQMYRIDASNPRQLVAVKHGAGKEQDGKYLLPFTVSVDGTKLLPGQRGENEAMGSKAYVYRDARINITKTWSAGTGNPQRGSSLKFDLRTTTSTSSTLIGTVTVTPAATGDTTASLQLNYLNFPSGYFGTRTYYLHESLTGSDYGMMAPMAISINRDEATGAVTFPSNGGTGVAAISITNTPDNFLGTVNFHKRDSSSGTSSIAGGTFKLTWLTDKDGATKNQEVMLVPVTGGYKYVVSGGSVNFSAAAGGVMITELPYGQYRLTEITPPDGYIKPSPDNITFTLDKNNKSITAAMSNVKFTSGSLTIYKKDQNSAVVTNASFALHRQDGSNWTSVGTSANQSSGTYSFSSLAKGYYRVTETIPSGFQNAGNTVIVYFTIDENGAASATGTVAADGAVTPTTLSAKTVILNWANTRLYGSIVITKVDETAVGSPVLAGATFQLRSGSYTGTILDTKTTGADGKVTFSNLPLGAYYVVESAFPAGYQAGSGTDRKTFQITQAVLTTGGGILTDTWGNKQQSGSIVITKTGEDASGAQAALAGVGFELYDSNKLKISEATTNASGSATFSGLLKGTYYVREVSAPNGYKINNPDYVEVEIGKDGNFAAKSLTFTNAREKRGIEVTKKTADTGAVQSGVVFTLAGTDFGNASINKTATTNASGVAAFTDIPYGTYTITETTSASGYARTTTISNVVVNSSSPATITYSVTNPPQKLTVKKIANGVSTSGLSGAEFKIRVGSSGNTYVQATGSNGSFKYTGTTTEAAATVFATVGTAGEFVLTHLPAGTYNIIETKAPEGYNLLTSPTAVNIVSTTEEASVQISNSDIKGNLRITKVDSNDKLLTGIQFKVTGPNGYTNTSTTNASGQITLSNLVYGEYTINEINTPAEYDPITNYKVSITQNGVTVDVKLVNNPRSGGVTITKKDTAGTLLSGAVFTMYPVNGSGTIVTTGVSYTRMTDSTGKAVFTGIPYGFYAILEVVAPANYTLDTEPRYVSVEGAAKPDGIPANKVYPNTFDWENTMMTGSLVVNKQDAGGSGLGGATFYLYKGTGSSREAVRLTDVSGSMGAGSWLYASVGGTPTAFGTNTTGIASITGLPYGTYQLEEYSAPSGYIKSSDTYTITISAQNTSPDQIVVNTVLKGAVDLRALDISTSALLAGAEIHVFHRLEATDDPADYINGAQTPLYTVNTVASGASRISSVPQGMYIAILVTPAYGYTPEQADIAQWFVINQSNYQTVQLLTFRHSRVSDNFTFTKVDAVSKAGLSGAWFSIEEIDTNGNTVAGGYARTVQSQAGGTVTFTGVPYGFYKVMESMAPSGYEKDATPRYISIGGAPGPSSATPLITEAYQWNNTKTVGSLTINKVNEQSQPLAATARFKLYIDDGGTRRGVSVTGSNGVYTYSALVAETSATEITTNAEGKIVVGNMLPGYYELVETVAPSGYMLDSTPKTVAVATNSNNINATCNFVNAPISGVLKVLKLDVDTRQPVAGAKINVYVHNGNNPQTPAGYASETPIGTQLVTNAQGSATMANLNAGVYVAVEVEPPYGYAPGAASNIVQQFTIQDSPQGMVVELTFENKKVQQDIVITKVDKDDASIKLANVTFSLIPVDANGQETVGNTLYAITDGTGVATFKNVPYGWYKIVEVSAPAGYSVSGVAPRYVAVGGAQFAPTVSPVEQAGFTWENELQKGFVQVWKVDSQGNAIATGNLARKPQFKLYRVDGGRKGVLYAGNPTSGGNFIFQGYATEAASHVMNLATESWLRVEGLPYGTYELVETQAPTGYMAGSPMTFVINESFDGLNGTDGYRFVNNPMSGNVDVSALNVTDSVLLGGVTVKIYAYESGKDTAADYTSAAVLHTINTLSTDWVNQAGFALGKYVAIQTDAPAGFSPVSVGEVFKTFEITESNYATTQKVQFNNQRVEGSLTFTKVDGSNTSLTLSGAMFSLVQVGDNDVPTGAYSDTKSSNTSGAVTFAGVPYGYYRITEVLAPSGYDLDSTPRYISIGGAPTPNGITNPATISGSGYQWKDTKSVGKLTIQKTNQDESLNLGGARFSLYLQDGVGRLPVTLTGSAGAYVFVSAAAGGTATEISTTAQGKVEITGLLPGVYEIQEMAAPSGYMLESRPMVVTVATTLNNRDVSVRFTNTLVSVRVDMLKLDRADNKPLSGAEFLLYEARNNSTDINVYSTATPVGQKTTNSQGVASFQDLPKGQYVVFENVPPYGYEKDQPAAQLFEITDSSNGNILTLTFRNTRVSADIVITKVDSANGNLKLGNAAFSLYEVAASGTKKTGGYSANAISAVGSGIATFSNVPYGLYAIEETVAPAGYQKDTTIRYVVVGGGLAFDPSIQPVVSQSFNWDNNKLVGSLTVKKTDGTNALAGAEFALYSNGQGVVLSGSAGSYAYSGLSGTSSAIQTDASGNVAINGLLHGVYELRETKAPTGYVLDTAGKNITISEQMPNVTYTFVNTKILGSVEITSHDDSVGSKPLIGGATIYIYNYEAGKNSPSDYAGAPLRAVTTVASGAKLETNLPLGEYVAIEVVQPSGYQPANTPFVRFSITEANFATAQKAQFFNPRILDSLSFTKVDKDDTAKGLAGAWFALTELDGNGAVKAGGVVMKEESSASGQVTFSGIPYGFYRVTEQTPPIGYEPDNTIYYLSIGGAPVPLGITNPVYIVSGFQWKNTKSVGKLTINKVDEQQAGLPGATFQLFMQDGMNKLPVLLSATAQGRYTFQSAPAAGTATTFGTDTNGVAVIDKLLPGVYELKEVTAPGSYMLEPNAQVIAVATASSNRDVSYTFKNTKVSARVDVVKEDLLSGAKLSGAVFHIYAAAVSNDPADYVGTPLYTGTTASNGIATFDNLPKGDYVVVEYTAPTGYRKDTAPLQRFTIDDASQGVIKTLTFKNERILDTITIRKVDAVDATPIPGATFRINEVNAAGNEISGGFTAMEVTNASGEAVFTNVPYGLYAIRETVAPADYQQDSSVRYVAIGGAVFGSGIVPVSKSFTWENSKLAGDLTIYKKEGVTPITATPAKFRLYLLDGANALPVRMSGVPGSYAYLGTGGTATEISTTAGEVTITGLLPGAYEIEETEAPAGYLLEILRKTVVVKGNEVTTYDFLNTKVSVRVDVQKVDKATGTPLTGAEFAIYRYNGSLLPGGYTGTPDYTGITGSPDGVAIFNDLPKGEYVVIETKAPVGYKLDTAVLRRFEITDASNGKITVVKFENEKILENLSFKKVDKATGAGLKDAVFTLAEVGDNDVVIATGYYDTQSSNSTGDVSFVNIPYGFYRITERFAPLGYELDAAPRYISIGGAPVPAGITVNSGNAIANGYTWENEKTVGNLTINKKEGATLITTDVAKFRLYLVDGMDSLPVTFTSGGAGSYTFQGLGVVGGTATEITNSGGIVTVTGLLPGTYEIEETKAPAGYMLEVLKKTVIIKGNQTTTYDFLNTRVSVRVDVQKVDDATGAPLAGAEFSIYDHNGSTTASSYTGTPVAIGTTAADGVATFSNMAKGRYVVIETKAPTGYRLAAIILQEFEITDASNGRITLLTFRNERILEDVTITKVDEADGAKLKQATFLLQEVDANGNVIATGLKMYAVSDVNGEATFKNVPYGLYAISETVSPNGYQPDSTIEYVAIGGAAFTSITPKANAFEWKNSKVVGSLTVDKVGEDTNTPGATIPLGDAEFELYLRDKTIPNKLLPVTLAGSAGAYSFTSALDTNVATKIATNASGRVVISGLLHGIYELKEVKAPDGYKLDAAAKAITISDQQVNAQYTFENALIRGMLEVEVCDEADNAIKLSGAVVQIFKKAAPVSGVDRDAAWYLSSATPIAELTTAHNGKASLDNLVLGDYVAIITEPADGYFKTSVILEEASLTPLATYAKMVFENRKISFTLNIDTVDKVTRVGLADAEYRVVHVAGGWAVDPSRLVSDSAGKISVTGLPKGEYKVEQIKAPDGYDDNTVIETVVFQGDQNATEQRTFENTYISGTVELTKLDEANKQLSGATFELHNAKTDDVIQVKEVATDEYEYTTSGGRTTFTAGKVTIANLPKGDYYLKETKAPAGYLILAEKYAFSVDNVSYKNLISVKAQNAPIEAGVAIRKVDSDNANLSLSGAEFVLYRSTDGGKSHTEEVTRKTSNDAGFVIFTKLTPGSYQVEETKAPNNYVKWAARVGFIVTSSGTIDAGSNTSWFKPDPDIGMYVVPIGNAMIQQEFRVKDVDKTTKEGLAGAEFLLTGGRGVSYTLTTSGTDGVSSYVKLPVGTYTMWMTKTPTGYQMLTDTYTVEVTATGISVNGIALSGSSPFTYTVEQERILSTIRLYKVDSVSSSPLAGASFTLTPRGTNAGNSYTLSTNANGQSGAATLTPGSYDLVETVTPSGYVKPLAGWTVTVGNDGVVSAAGAGISAGRNGSEYLVTVANTPEDIPLGGGSTTTTTTTTTSTTSSGSSTTTSKPNEQIPLGPGLPQTGELSNTEAMILGAFMLLMSLVALLLFVALGEKRKYHGMEILEALM